jgi:ATP-binding cassette subfamily B protein
MNNFQEINPLPNKLLPFVWCYLKNKKWCMAGFVLIALVWALELSISPYLLKIIIDTVVSYASEPNKIGEAIFIPALLYVLMSLLLNFNFRLYDYINLRLYPDVKGAVNRDMFSYLLDHSYTFFQNNFVGNLTKKIWDMVENIEYLISIPNEWFYPRFFAVVIASLTLFFVVRPIFGIILFLWAILFVYVSYLAAKGSEKYARRYSENGSIVVGTVADAVSNVISTKLFDNSTHEISHLNNDIKNVQNAERALRWYDLKIDFIRGLGATLLMTAMFIALIHGVKEGLVTAGDFALVITLSLAFLWTIHDVGKQMQRFAKVVGICNQALSFLRLPHEITDDLNAKPLVVTQGIIQFAKVSFHYENNQPLFIDLNITINSGEKVGLVGFSGGGKSTFIKLILRLLDTQNGSILIDNQVIKNVDSHSLRKQISTIPQEPDLFHRTIMENIRFAKLDATDEEVITAAKHAKCHEFICELPQQYQSLVGERGIKLSGGQKQRIAIARAFLKNAPILLLDEATSSLDSITERHIHEALHAVMANKTTIVIAHRLSTLRNMDRILVFDNGTIIEDGTLDTLLANKNGHFAKLWQMQVSGFIPEVTE